MEEFHTQLRSLENSMLLKAKQKVQSENKIIDEQIKTINQSFVKQLVEDLLELTVDFLKNYEYKLNKLILENMNDLSQRILYKKNTLFNEFKNYLNEKIITAIEKNSKDYIKFLCGRIRKHLDYLESPVKIQMTSNDQRLFPDIAKEFSNLKIDLIKEPLGAIGGIKIANADFSLIIDETIDNIIQSKENAIKSIFSQIFKEYKDTRKNATELMEGSSINRVFEMPKELNDFIAQEKIKYEG